MTRGENVTAIYDSSFCPFEEIRPVPLQDTCEILRRFYRAAASKTLLREFVLLNGFINLTQERKTDDLAAGIR